MPNDNATLALNRRALELFDPRTAAAIAVAASSADVRLGEADPDRVPAGLQARDTVVLLGIGDGANLLKLLNTPAEIVVVECEATACAAILSRHDLSAALARGQLRFFIMPCASLVSREISLRECSTELINYFHRPDRSLHFVSTATTSYRNNFAFFSDLRRGMENGVQTVSRFASARRGDAAYDVTVVSPCCAIFDDLAQCFLRLGLQVQLLRVPDAPGTWDAEQLQAVQLSLASQPSRLVVTRNRALLETEGPTAYPQPEALIPGHTAMWWWDVPNLASHIDLRHPRGHARAFGFARDILPLLPQGAEWLPPGARTPFVEAGTQPESVQDIGLSFVGQSRLQNLHANLDHLKLVLTELGASAAALARDLSAMRGYEALHGYVSRHGGDIREKIATRAAAYPAHAYYLSYLLDMVISGAFRIAAIECVAREGIDLSLFGDDDWLKVPGVTARSFKGICPPAELPALYRRSRVNLNLNFMQVSSTVNPKVLDIAAAGGVALTDHRPELDLLYPAPAARPFAFRTLEEMISRIVTLQGADLAHHRQAVRDHTQDHHTLQHRARWLASYFGLQATA